MSDRSKLLIPALVIGFCLVGFLLYWNSRPDPRAIAREQGFQTHAESIAASVQRLQPRVETLTVYRTRIVQARLVTDSALTLGTTVPELGTDYVKCDIRVARIAAAVHAERAITDSTLRADSGVIAMQARLLSERGVLLDSVLGDLHRANRRGVSKLALAAEYNVSASRVQLSLTAHVTTILGLDVRAGVAYSP